MRRIHRTLYFWVIVGVIAGVTLGIVAPDYGVAMRPLGDGFVRLIKMLVTPIVFCTIVLGIANVRELRDAGRVGVKALVYFEVLTTVALAIGLVVVNVFRPGDGFHVDPATLDPSVVAQYTSPGNSHSFVAFLLDIIPTTFSSALVSGALLQVILIAVLLGVALSHVGERGRPLVDLIEAISATVFKLFAMIMWLAPLGAFGAMAFTLGKYGVDSLKSLGALMACFYLTCIAFVAIALGAVAALCGYNVWRLVIYLRGELLLVLGTSSSESALARLMQKLTLLGCRSTTVGLVVPTGYSFNLDGTSIYLTIAAVFLAQALDIELTLTQQLTILLVAMVSSKGAAAVTGGGFITLAATLAVVPSVPVAAMALIFGVDRFMSEARALTNLIGNAVATVAISRWEGEVSGESLRAALADPGAPEVATRAA